MGLNKKFMMYGGWFCSFILVACGTTFPYKFYGLNAASYEGTLLGEDEDDDLPLKRCKPDDFEKGKCVVMFVAEFERLKADLIECSVKLEDCEKSCK